MTARSFLVRGLLIGLLAGFATFLVAHQVGEPHVEAAIALEEAQATPDAAATDDAHDQADDSATVSRSDQRTWGLLTGSLAVGVALGGLVALVAAAVVGRIGRLTPGQSTALVSLVGFVAVALVPFLKYPATPPAVGSGETIGDRTSWYFGFVLISVAVAALSSLLAVRVAEESSTYAAVLTGSGLYLVVMVVAGQLMPTVNEVGDFPADLLWYFRRASLFTLVTLWAVIGIGLTGLVGRLHRQELRRVERRELGGQPVTAVSVDPPSSDIASAAAERLAALATPPGALGRLGDLAVWIASTQGQCPPPELTNVRLVIFAGDHGVARHGVSAYPPEITAAMVRTFVAGKAGVSALARAHRVAVRVLDLGVDDDLAGVPEEVRRHRVRRGSGAIHLEDALTPEQTREALAVGAVIARQEIAAGAQLLISGDMGIGNTTPAAALVAAGLGLPAGEVVGRGTGVDDAALSHKQRVIQEALDRTGGRADDPVDCLTALGSADLAACTGYLVEAARQGLPVLLDGLMAVACALTADRIVPGTAAWFAAGHRSTEPAQSLALAKLGLEPVLDLGLRLGEGSGAVAAVPVLRSAVALLRDVALLSELLPPDA